MTTIVYWASRHFLFRAQKDELKRLFGENFTEIKGSGYYRNAEDLQREFQKSGADVLIVGTLPTAMLLQLHRLKQPFYFTKSIREHDGRLAFFAFDLFEPEKFIRWVAQNNPPRESSRACPES